jgi:adenylate cyclase
MKITYHNEKTVDETDTALPLLAISLKNGIQHIHVCGGNARCSTCRVMVTDGLCNLSPRNEKEETLALRKGLDPNVRLACQTHTCGDVTIRRLVHDEQDIDFALAEEHGKSGREAEIAILFTDIRNFTPMAEKQLPYDVIHMLSRYFRVAGEAVLSNGGFIDKYIGDGMMALFGLDDPDPFRACMGAIRAALEIQSGLGALNEHLRTHFDLEFRVGAGIHFGTCIVGQLGHPSKMQYSAIGDTVNIASRVESATKDAGVELLVTNEVYDRVAEHVEIQKVVTVPLKGKRGEHTLFAIHSATMPAITGLSPARLVATVRARLRRAVSRRTAPMFLRLAYHDATSFDPVTRTGGANGSVRFPQELARRENRGLAEAIKLLEPIKAEMPEVSWADLIAVAGAVAVAQTGGPDIYVPMGRIDSDVPDPENKMPHPDMTLEQAHALFDGLGLTMREWTALSGAHTIGKNLEGRSFTDDPFRFTNSYFRLLVQGNDKARAHLLKTDNLLLDDPGCRGWAAAYAMDQDLFFADFAAAYRKMTLIGAQFQVTAQRLNAA